MSLIFTAIYALVNGFYCLVLSLSSVYCDALLTWLPLINKTNKKTYSLKQ